MIDLKGLERCECDHDSSEHYEQEKSCQSCDCRVFIRKMGHPGNPVDKWNVAMPKSENDS